MVDIQHSALTGANLHEPKGVASAASGQLYVADGAGSGAWTTLATNEVANVINVDALGDFPAPVANVITLAANTAYRIIGNVDLGANRLVANTNTVIFGVSRAIDTLTTSSASAMITANNTNLILERVGLTSSAGPIFSYTTATDFDLTLNDIQINNCTDYGTITAVRRCRILDSGFFTSTADGWSFVGACRELNIQRCTVESFVGTGIDLGTATFDLIVLREVRVVTDAGTTGLVAAANSANINAGLLGFLNENYFDATTGTAQTGLTAGDLRWEIRDNIGIVSSQKGAQGSITGNATATTFSGTGAGNDVVVNFGTAFVADIQSSFTISNAGRATYIGSETRDFLVTVPFSASIGGGAARTYNFYVAKNGVIIASSVNQRTYDGANTGAATVNSLVELSTNDYIELYARAETATTSLTVDTAGLTVVRT